jgi:tetratricopeptide (TPR) repeat protein
VRSHRPRGRLSGVDLRPGAVRQARLESGLSLAQLAGEDLTRQAVHLIETGKARPSRRSLRILAGRLGLAEASLLAQPDDNRPDDGCIGELELLCQRHEYVRAVERAQEIIGWGGSRRIIAFARHYQGQALYYLERPADALRELREARTLFEAEANPWFVAESMGWEAMALNGIEDGGALTLGQDALRRYRGLQPRRPETEARMLRHIGTILYVRRAYERAVAYYEEALQAAGGIRDLAEIGRIYHGLGMSWDGLGDLRRATDLVFKAVTLYEAEHRMSPAPARSLLPRAENDLGLLRMKQGDLDRADELFQAALVHFREAGVERIQSHVHLSLCDLRRRQGRLADAARSAGTAIELATRTGEQLAVASGHQQLGALQALDGQRRLADASFRRALGILEAAGMHERIAECRAAHERAMSALAPARSGAALR